MRTGQKNSSESGFLAEKTAATLVTITLAQQQSATAAATGVFRPATSQESQQINDLRTVVPKLCEANNGTGVDDGYILRWLRSKEGRFDETAEGLKRNMIFRKAWDLDSIDKWVAPEILEKYCGYGFLADREGNPILMSLLGNMDVEAIHASKKRASLGVFHWEENWIFFAPVSEEIMQRTYYLAEPRTIPTNRGSSRLAIEKGMQLCHDRAVKSNRAFEQMTLIFDLDHITSVHYSHPMWFTWCPVFSSKQFASSFTTLILLFQEHYPLVLRKILIIRAPEMASIAFKSMTPFLSNSIQDLIEMPSEDTWQSCLNQYVDLDAWPMHWGGRMCDANGDPKCPSKIRYGMGPVPESYFVDQENVMPDYDQITTVYAGDKHLIELKVKANTRVSWTYLTKEEDIGFAIYFDKTNCANNLAEMEVVYPYIRLECSQVPISDSILCEHKGRYIIEFDNYYSWLCAKQLRYNIEIDEPEDAEEECRPKKTVAKVEQEVQ